MKLTDKCLQDFQEFKLLDPFYKNIEVYPDNMKFGVYVDFFLEMHVIMQFKLLNSGVHVTIGASSGKGYLCRVNEYKCIKEARIKAVESANEVYNIKYDETKYVIDAYGTPYNKNQE